MDYPHLEDLQLADSLNDNYGTIDVLIGCDYYWEIVSGETLRGDSGPTAVSSKFGWLLSGPLRDSVTSDTLTSNLIISGEICSARKRRTDKEPRKILGNRGYWNSRNKRICFPTKGRIC